MATIKTFPYSYYSQFQNQSSMYNQSPVSATASCSVNSAYFAANVSYAGLAQNTGYLRESDFALRISFDEGCVSVISFSRGEYTVPQIQESAQTVASRVYSSSLRSVAIISQSNSVMYLLSLRHAQPLDLLMNSGTRSPFTTVFSSEQLSSFPLFNLSSSSTITPSTLALKDGVETITTSG